MKKVLLGFVVVLLFFIEIAKCIPIETPDIPEECNNFMISCPSGWGYRTFDAENGLIGVFWPEDTTFNATDTAVFVFLQDNNKKLPEEPENLNLFTEKCTKATFNFSFKDDDPTESLAEKYFSGRCGRTMIIFKERVKNYHVILALVSAKYISKKQLNDVKQIAKNYKQEIKTYLANRLVYFDDEDEEEKEKDETEEKIW